jgi:hypothetical protein
MRFLLDDELARKIADHVAREIFKVGDEPEGPATRIQYMTGTWPENEKAGGGLCEIALAALIHTRLRMWPAQETKAGC